MIDTSLDSLREKLKFAKQWQDNRDHIDMIEAAINLRADLDFCTSLFNDSMQAPRRGRVQCCYCDWQSDVIDFHDKARQTAVATEHVKSCTKSPSYLLQIRLCAVNDDAESLRTQLMNSGYVLAQQLVKVDDLEEDLDDISDALLETGEFDDSDVKSSTMAEAVEYLGSRLKDVKAERNELAAKVETVEDNLTRRVSYSEVRDIVGAVPVEGTLEACSQRMMERAQAHRALAAIDNYWISGNFGLDHVLWSVIKAAREATK